MFAMVNKLLHNTRSVIITNLLNLLQTIYHRYYKLVNPPSGTLVIHICDKPLTVDISIIICIMGIIGNGHISLRQVHGLREGNLYGIEIIIIFPMLIYIITIIQ